MNLNINWAFEILKSTEEEIFIINQEGIIFFINRDISKIFNKPTNQLLGNSFFDVLFNIVLVENTNKSAFVDQLSIWSEKEESFDFIIESLNSEKNNITLTINPINISDNHNYFKINIYTKKNVAFQREKLIEENTLFSGGTAVIFKWKPNSQWIIDYVSPNVFNIFGYSDTLLMNGSFSYTSLIHPEDLERLIEDAREKNKSNYPCYEQNYRLKHANGNYRHVYDFTTVTKEDVNGSTVYHGAIVDITENLEAIASAKFNEERLNTLINAVPDLIFFKDGQGKWLIINEAAKRAFNLINDEDWKNRTDIELAQINILRKAAHLFCVKSDEDAWNAQKLIQGVETLSDKFGKDRFYHVTKVPLFYENNVRKGLVIVGKDITEQKLLEEEQKNSNQIQEILHSILKISLDDKGIKETLNEILKIITNSFFANLHQQAAVFLADEKMKNLILTSHVNFPIDLQNLYAVVELEKSICSNVVITKKSQFYSSQDVLPENNFISIKKLGRYCVPILYQNEILGILMFYLNEGHQYNEIEILFLESVADIMSSMINRKKAEEQNKIYIKSLENLDKINNILQKINNNNSNNDIHQNVLNAILDIFACDSVLLKRAKNADLNNWNITMNCSSENSAKIWEAGTELRISPNYKTAILKAIETKEPFIFDINDINEILPNNKITFKSAIGILIIPKTGLPWLLCIYQINNDRIWTNEEKFHFKQIAERYTPSLNNLLLLEELKKSESQYRSLSETARDLIVTYDLNGNIVYMNNIGLEFVGLNEQNYKGRNIFEFITNGYKDFGIEKLAANRNGFHENTITENFLQSKDKENILFEINTSSLDLGEGKMGAISVCRNITDRKLTETKLLQQNAELKLINQELDRFVYSTSHDLRAPLTSVLGLLNLAKKLPPGNIELPDYFEMMETSIHNLDNVIKSIIEYSKTNRITIQDELVDVHDIYDKVISGIYYLQGMDKIKKNCNIIIHAPFISDSIRITAIIRNLITNAFKYRNEENESIVNFSFESTSDFGIITIADNGIGIPEDKHQKIFDMFYRATSQAEGNGLGLYIVKQNVEKLNGTIDLRSEVGIGTTFVVKIPNKQIVISE